MKVVTAHEKLKSKSTLTNANLCYIHTNVKYNIWLGIIKIAINNPARSLACTIQFKGFEEGIALSFCVKVINIILETKNAHDSES